MACNFGGRNFTSSEREGVSLILKRDPLNEICHGWHILRYLAYIFVNSSFVIRFNFLHPSPSLFLCGLLLYVKCFSIVVNYYFQVPFNFAVLYLAKITQISITQLVD